MFTLQRIDITGDLRESRGGNVCGGCVCVCRRGLMSWNTRGSQPLAEEAYHQWNIVLLGTSPENM